MWFSRIEYHPVQIYPPEFRCLLITRESNILIQIYRVNPGGNLRTEWIPSDEKSNQDSSRSRFANIHDTPCILQLYCIKRRSGIRTICNQLAQTERLTFLYKILSLTCDRNNTHYWACRGPLEYLDSIICNARRERNEEASSLRRKSVNAN